VKFVLVQSGIRGFEFIQRAQFFWFLQEEELCRAQSWNDNFMLRKCKFSHSS